MSQPISGQCLCGEVRFSATVQEPTVMSCYCSDCQRSTGGTHASFVPMDAGVMEVQGTPRDYSVKGESGGLVTRFFCGSCGSPVWSEVEVVPGKRFVKTGVIDQKEALSLAAQIWTSSKSHWVQLAEGVPAFEKNPG